MLDNNKVRVAFYFEMNKSIWTKIRTFYTSKTRSIGKCIQDYKESMRLPFEEMSIDDIKFKIIK